MYVDCLKTYYAEIFASSRDRCDKLQSVQQASCNKKKVAHRRSAPAKFIVFYLSNNVRLYFKLKKSYE